MMDDIGRQPAGRNRVAGRAETGIIIIAAVAMFVVALKAPLLVWWASGFDEAVRLVMDWTYYNVSFLSASYFNVGFVRRALGGTISRLLSPDPYFGAFLFHVASAALLIIPVALLQRRLLLGVRRPAAWFMIFFALLSPQMFVGWANDIARTDLFVIGTIAWSILMIHGGRPIWAGAMLTIGFMAHETAIIFGVPLLVAVMATGASGRPVISRNLVWMIAGLGIAVVALAVVQALGTPDTMDFGQAMLRDTPPPIDAWHRDLRDCAIYMMITGMRGLRTAICYNFYWPGYVVVAICAIGVTILNGIALNLDRRLWGFALAVMLPMVFMIAIANDTGRWVKFACANAWLLSAIYQLRGEVVPGKRRLVLAIALTGCLIYLGSSTVHQVNRASVSVLRRLDMRFAPEVADWMTHCDPAWRAVAHGRPSPVPVKPPTLVSP